MVSTKTYYRRQGILGTFSLENSTVFQFTVCTSWFARPLICAVLLDKESSSLETLRRVQTFQKTKEGVGGQCGLAQEASSHATEFLNLSSSTHTEEHTQRNIHAGEHTCRGTHGGTHTHTHHTHHRHITQRGTRGMHMQMLHLHFTSLPFKKFPTSADSKTEPGMRCSRHRDCGDSGLGCTPSSACLNMHAFSGIPSRSRLVIRGAPGRA